MVMPAARTVKNLTCVLLSTWKAKLPKNDDITQRRVIKGETDLPDA